MSTSSVPDEAASPAEGELTFVAHDLGRDQVDAGNDSADEMFAPRPETADTPAPPVAPRGFHVSSGLDPTPSAPRTKTADELPWTVRGEARPEPAAEGPWSPRQSDVIATSATTAMRRLRQEAVDTSWKAAWRAVTSAGPQRRHRRRSA